MSVRFTLGCDPEIFLRNKEGKLISAVGLIGGSKWEPLPITTEGHAILEDNVAVEFNTPPADDAITFHNHIKLVLDHLVGRVSEMGLEFAYKISAASFDRDQLNTPQAQEFGCEPDFNAWTGKVNTRPQAVDSSLRSCGGHVHVGTTLDGKSVIRAMDLFLGIPSLQYDVDNKRRQLYGKAGCYRPKPYGVEYRTLSNFWIFEQWGPNWVYGQTKRALEWVESGETINQREGLMIRRAINQDDLDARAYIEREFKSVIYA